jgi:hypothetical protein
VCTTSHYASQRFAWLHACMAALQVLAIYGELDSKFIGDLPKLEKLFPKFQAVIMPGATHPAYLSDPAFFNAQLVELARNISQPLATSASGACSRSAQCLHADQKHLLPLPHHQAQPCKACVSERMFMRSVHILQQLAHVGMCRRHFDGSIAAECHTRRGSLLLAVRLLVCGDCCHSAWLHEVCLLLCSLLSERSGSCRSHCCSSPGCSDVQI